MNVESVYRKAGIILTPIGDRFTAPCPFHRESKPSFIVYPDGGFHCFGCGAHGNPEDIGDIFGLSIMHITDLETIRDPLVTHLAKLKDKYEAELELYVFDKSKKKIFKAYDQFDQLMMDAEEFIKDMEATPLRLLAFIKVRFEKITGN